MPARLLLPRQFEIRFFWFSPLLLPATLFTTATRLRTHTAHARARTHTSVTFALLPAGRRLYTGPVLTTHCWTRATSRTSHTVSWTPRGRCLATACTRPRALRTHTHRMPHTRHGLVTWTSHGWTGQFRLRLRTPLHCAAHHCVWTFPYTTRFALRAHTVSPHAPPLPGRYAARFGPPHLPDLHTCRTPRVTFHGSFHTVRFTFTCRTTNTMPFRLHASGTRLSRFFLTPLRLVPYIYTLHGPTTWTLGFYFHHATFLSYSLSFHFRFTFVGHLPTYLPTRYGTHIHTRTFYLGSCLTAFLPHSVLCLVYTHKTHFLWFTLFALLHTPHAFRYMLCYLFFADTGLDSCGSPVPAGLTDTPSHAALRFTSPVGLRYYTPHIPHTPFTHYGLPITHLPVCAVTIRSFAFVFHIHVCTRRTITLGHTHTAFLAPHWFCHSVLDVLHTFTYFYIRLSDRTPICTCCKFLRVTYFPAFAVMDHVIGRSLYHVVRVLATSVTFHTVHLSHLRFTLVPLLYTTVLPSCGWLHGSYRFCLPHRVTTPGLLRLRLPTHCPRPTAACVYLRFLTYRLDAFPTVYSRFGPSPGLFVPTVYFRWFTFPTTALGWFHRTFALRCRLRACLTRAVFFTGYRLGCLPHTGLVRATVPHSGSRLPHLWLPVGTSVTQRLPFLRLPPHLTAYGLIFLFPHFTVYLVRLRVGLCRFTRTVWFTVYPFTPVAGLLHTRYICGCDHTHTCRPFTHTRFTHICRFPSWVCPHTPTHTTCWFELRFTWTP